jgi:hypothetical protein
MLVHPSHMDLDDRVFHYLLVGIGLGLGSLVKVGFDFLAERFWDKEYKAFKQWKAEQDKK